MAVYRELLAHLSQLREEHELWVTVPGEIDRWWRARQAMSLVQRSGEWGIEGPQSERARVAYATLQNGQVVYELPER